MGFSYSLAPHVHACSIDEQVILLDLKRDSYLGVRPSDSALVGAHVRGWPALPDRSAAAATAGVQSCQDLLDELTRAGMISSQEGFAAVEPRPARIEAPTVALIEGYCEDRPDISRADVLRFITATLRTKCALKLRSLYWIANRVRHRRRGIEPQPGNAGESARIEEMQLLVGVYLRLRVLLFTAVNECLFDSLALSTFLAGCGHYPNVIIGVATSPFAAHCWLQHGGVVVNDTPEHVRKYHPILIV